MKKPNGRDWILLILAIAIGFVICWFFFRPKPEPSPINLQPLIEKREDVVNEIEKLDTLFKVIEEIKKEEHETIDSTNSNDELRSITGSILARKARHNLR